MADDDLLIAQLAMEAMTADAPCTSRTICSSADIESALPTADLKASITDLTGDNGARSSGRGVAGKKSHLKGHTASVTVRLSSRIKLSCAWYQKLECASCCEKFSTWRCIVAPCSHVFCRKCIVSLIETCIQDETLYPVKCCKQPLSKTQLSRSLNAKRRAVFELKYREFSTSPDLRTYCSNPQCSAFIGSSSGRLNDMVCVTCRTSTCIKCRQRSHAKETCEDNADTLKVHELARKEGWQTCPGCKSIVELHEGCLHMTCRCRTEFCYLCGTKWKRCKCLQWREDHAAENVEDVAENEVQNVRQAERRALKHILMRWIRRLR